jgi:V/A-type H+-transporting ATPase subunit C
MNNLDYIYAVSRIRVKEQSLLTDSDISAMIPMKTEDEVLDYLQSKGWGTDAENSASAVLAAEERRTLEAMEDLGLDEETMNILSYPKLFHNLKTGIQEVTTAESPGRAYYDLPGFGKAEVRNILERNAFDELPEALRTVAPSALEIMLKTRDGQMCDTIVDKACLEAMSAAAKHSKNRLLQQYLELTVALTDIRIAVRASRMGKSEDYLKRALANTALLDVNGLILSASEAVGKLEEAKDADQENPLYRYLERAGFSAAVEALKVSPAAFERWCDNELIDLIRPMRTVNESVGPVLAYYLARENEIKTVRIILTAKANDFPDEVIEERVRKMYV